MNPYALLLGFAVHMYCLHRMACPAQTPSLRVHLTTVVIGYGAHFTAKQCCLNTEYHFTVVQSLPARASLVFY